MTEAVHPVRIEHLRDLPSLPQVVADLQAALSRDDASLDELADAVSKDQGLAARTLRIANSSFYGVRSRVASIRQAVGVLGLRSLSTLLTAAAVSDRFRAIQCEGFELRQYWRHSVAVALCAREMARLRRIDADTAFTAGLLHDLGRVGLASQLPDRYEEACRWRNDHDCQLVVAERACLATDHAAIGGDIATRWHFGAPIVDAIRFHHEPPNAPGATLVDVVHVADNIAHALDLARDPNDMVPPLDPAAWNRVGMHPGEAFALFESTEMQVDSVCEALAV
jgi:putative nucleotidyltransferase with HDIG domain